jgi:hypothetical protein
MLNRHGPLRRRIFICVAAAGLVLAAAINVISAPLASAASGAPVSHAELSATADVSFPDFYTLVNWHSRMCLDTPAGYTAQQEPCTGSSTQQWYLYGTYAITTLPDDGFAGCLGIPGSSTALGTDAVLTSCADTPNREWTLEPGPTVDGTQLYFIVNANSGYCLTDTNTSTAAGAHISQSTCNAVGATLWYPYLCHS